MATKRDSPNDMRSEALEPVHAPVEPFPPAVTVAKRRVADLAILGGAPAFPHKLHVGRPNIGNRQRLLERINDILDRRWLTNNGSYVQEFERRIAELVGVKHCIAMCNGTVALEIAIRALGLTGEIIVPSLTFVATVHALQWQEITPVFADVDPENLTIDPRRAETLITPRTTGIIGVHLFGRSCDIDALVGIADRRNLRLMFDAAHAFGCSYKGKRIGGFGEAEVFSFHATKLFNTLEGGAVVTNDDALAEKIRLMKNFGFAGYDHVIYIGTNGKMNEFSAAMGLTGLESLEAFLRVNQQHYRSYVEGLADVPGITLRRYDEEECNNYHYIVVQVDEEKTGISRDDLVKVLHAENVIARRYFHPGSHRMEPYRSYFPHAGLLLPVTERVSRQLLSLPTGTGITEAEIHGISQTVRFVVENGAEISWQLKRYPSPASGGWEESCSRELREEPACLNP